MAAGLSNGRARLLVLLSVSTCLTTSQHHTNQHKSGQNTRKPKRTIFATLIETNFPCSHQKTINRLRTMTRTRWCKETPWTSALPTRRWMEECTGWSPYLLTLRRNGFQKPSSASLSSLLYPPDHWIKIPAGLPAVAVLMGHVRYGQCTSTSCTREGKQGKHHRGTTHGILAHRIAKGMHTGQSGCIGPICKWP